MSEQMCTDIRPIPGIRGYGVHENGFIYSRRRQGSAKLGDVWRLLRPSISTTGYLETQLPKDSTIKPGKKIKLHHLVLLAYKGQRPKNHLGCHLNDDRLDNRPCNLTWGTRRENVKHWQTNGSSKKVTKSRLAKRLASVEEEVPYKLIDESTLTPIPNHPTYALDINGQLYSKKFRGQMSKYWSRLDGYVATGKSNKGYVLVNVDGRFTKLHILMAETFLGERPKGYVIRHLNDVKHDNRLCNLAYGTFKENNEDSYKNGRRKTKRQTGVTRRRNALTMKYTLVYLIALYLAINGAQEGE